MSSLVLLLLISGPLLVEPFAIPIPSFSDLKKLFEFTYTIYSKLNEVHDTYNKFTTKGTLDNIFEAVTDIAQSVNKMGSKIDRKIDDAVQTLLTQLPLVGKVDADLRELNKLIASIDIIYQDFEAYAENTENYNKETLRTFANSVTSPGRSDLSYIQGEIFSIIAPGYGRTLKESLILLLGKQAEITFYEACNTGVSPNEQLYQIYLILLISELKSYVMIASAYTYRSTFQEGSFMGEVRLREQQLEKRLEVYSRIFEEALRWAPRTLRSCDPPTHNREDTFYEFERFVNSYVISEEALTSDHDCKSTCEQQNFPTRQHRGCAGFECWRTMVTCHGTITGCTAQSKMEVCEVDMPAYRSRRYQWVRNEKGNVFGNMEGGCPGRRHNIEWYWKHKVFACDTCLCTCVDDHYESRANHFVSLRPVLSDISDNMIVTGLIFIITDGILQIQIQESQLGPEGTIVPDEVYWVYAEELSFEGGKSAEENRYVFQKRHKRIPNSDIAILDNEHRAINLDQLEAPPGHLITGIKFMRVETGNRPVQIAIHVTPFDYAAGKLINTKSSRWITPDDMKGVLDAYNSERQELKQLNYLMSPLDIQLTKPNFTPNKWIQIEKTGEREDTGQTVIPLLDGVLVAPNPTMPITGVNLFHKAAEKYGGFLSFQLLTIDRSKYINFTKSS